MTEHLVRMANRGMHAGIFTVVAFIAVVELADPPWWLWLPVGLLAGMVLAWQVGRHAHRYAAQVHAEAAP